MKNNISRKKFLKQGATLFAGTMIGSTIDFSSIVYAANYKPIRMMYNENPYGPSSCLLYTSPSPRD